MRPLDKGLFIDYLMADMVAAKGLLIRTNDYTSRGLKTPGLKVGLS